ncbi:MAG: hypothetical protein JF584_03180 [Acidobacteria bacterium]|nr:hypothetical protein [Acidobacteriota bacterium]
MGIIPADVKLPPREAGDPSWNSLTDQQKRVYARFMATYAGYIEHSDAQIDKVLAYLKAAGIDKDTHKMNTPFDQDRWQLFNVKDGPTESTDLAQKYPKKLQEMKDLCQKEAEKYGDLLMEETQFSRGFADAFLD